MQIDVNQTNDSFLSSATLLLTFQIDSPGLDLFWTHMAYRSDREIMLFQAL